MPFLPTITTGATVDTGRTIFVSLSSALVDSVDSFDSTRVELLIDRVACRGADGTGGMGEMGEMGEMGGWWDGGVKGEDGIGIC